MCMNLNWWVKGRHDCRVQQLCSVAAGCLVTFCGNIREDSAPLFAEPSLQYNLMDEHHKQFRHLPITQRNTQTHVHTVFLAYLGIHIASILRIWDYMDAYGLRCCHPTLHLNLKGHHLYLIYLNLISFDSCLLSAAPHHTICTVHL